MGCARRGELNIRVDPKDGSITFVEDAFVPADELQQPAASTSSPTARGESSIQPSVAELVRTRLSKVAVCLHNSLHKTEDSPEALCPEEQAENFKALVVAVGSERRALQLKRAIVARRRELLSELSVRKKQENNRRAELSRREKEEEARRVREDLRKREQERTKKEIESIRIDEAKKYAQSLADMGILKPNDVDVSFIVCFVSCSFLTFSMEAEKH